jgi:predicted nucleotidyltransferase
MVDVNPNLRPSLYTLIGISDELEDVLGIKVDVISSASVPAQLRERLASEAVAL